MYLSSQNRIKIDSESESLPADLHEAVECLKSDDFIREILGEHIYDKYIEAKEAEWNDYRAAVTQWEIDEYLYKF